MAENGVLAAPSPRGRADGEDAEPPEERMAETPRDDQEQFECQELLECQVQVGVPEEEEDPGLVAEAEAVAAGWTRDSAEGEYWARPVRGCAEAGSDDAERGGNLCELSKPSLQRSTPGGSGDPGCCGARPEALS